MDDYGDENGMIVRCPLPPANYSAVVNLMKFKGNGVVDMEAENGIWKSNQTDNLGKMLLMLLCWMVIQQWCL
ncbi:hypothetical protein A4A49_31601 [Nicotiana attenuata]|uniref:Uncharacterized protein n=1 Tax=Nicotiana attenuata TaxID=49451 RepID=A0A314KXI8_NICAT|nr:hypothetical protein A4A49_31601 [Nicotiana attenuata]